MKYQKEQNQSTSQNNISHGIIVYNTEDIIEQGNTKTLFSVRNNIVSVPNEGFHFREVVAWIMSRMHLEFGKKYKLSEIINNVLETGNQIRNVKGKYFDSDLYLGVKGQITTDFRKHVLLNILVEDESEKESLAYILEHLNDEVTINQADLISHINIAQTEYILKLYSTDKDNLNEQIVVIVIPY